MVIIVATTNNTIFCDLFNSLNSGILNCKIVHMPPANAKDSTIISNIFKKHCIFCTSALI